MVSSTLVQIFTMGPMERVIYGNPQITFFKSVYKRPTNFVSQYKVKSPFKKADWGETVTIPIPREADLLGGVYVRIKVSDLVRKYKYYTNHILDQENSASIILTVNSDVNDDQIAIANQQQVASEFMEQRISDNFTNVVDDNFTFEPQFTSYSNGLGSIIIEYASIMIGNKEIERISGEWIWLNSELTYEGNAKKTLNKALYFNEIYRLGTTNIDNVDMIIPIPFFFTKDSGSYLPIMAINNEKIEIVIKLNSLENCLTHKIQTSSEIFNTVGLYGRFTYNSKFEDGTDFATQQEQALGEIQLGEPYIEEMKSNIEIVELILNYYHVGPEEQTYFLTKKHHYVVPLIKELPSTVINYQQITKTHEIPLEMRNPVKYIVFVLQREDNFKNKDYLNMTYENILADIDNFVVQQPDNNNTIVDRFNLTVDSIELLDKLPAKTLNTIELMTKFKNNSSSLFYAYSFAMYPNEPQPSGTLNFTHFSNQFIKLDLSDIPTLESQNLLFRGYYSSYNILTIHDGLCGLRYV